jgi:hypothetical protein
MYHVTPKLNAPAFDSCISCLKGDTDTGFGVAITAPDDASEDEVATYLVALVSHATGISSEEVPGILSVYAQENPEAAFDYLAIRLCENCAAKSGTAVGKVTKGGLPTLLLHDLILWSRARPN